MEIVPMTYDDITQIAAIEQQCFSDPWSEKAFADEMNNPLAVYLVAKDNGMCAGYCGFWNVSGEGGITNVAVAPEYRQKGVGTQLIKKMVEQAIEMQLSLLTLEVRVSNLPAQRLYEKFGFEKVGVRPNYYSNPRENAWIMTKNLDA